MFTSCDYVASTLEVPLNETENQLEPVFNLARISVEAGDISQSCFISFSAFYCHQVFSSCERMNLTVENSQGFTVVSASYRPVNASLCLEDCESTIGTDCSAQHWNILTNFIDELARKDSIQIPSLQPRSDCNSSLAMANNCISINPGKEIVSRQQPLWQLLCPIIA